jgi:hypothetical protein
MAWKTKFDAEMNELKSRRVKETPEPKGLSGRVIFFICYIGFLDLWCWIYNYLYNQCLSPLAL